MAGTNSGEVPRMENGVDELRRGTNGRGWSGDELHDGELGTTRARARRRTRGVAAGDGVLHGLAPVTAIASNRVRARGKLGCGRESFVGMVVQFIEKEMGGERA